MSIIPLLKILIAVPVCEVFLIDSAELNILGKWCGDEFPRDVSWHNLLCCLVLDPNNVGIFLGLFVIVANEIACQQILSSLVGWCWWRFRVLWWCPFALELLVGDVQFFQCIPCWDWFSAIDVQCSMFRICSQWYYCLDYFGYGEDGAIFVRENGVVGHI